MAHPLVWPGKYFFYPIGNTPAICLTRDLAPEESADVVLLGCGDPRHVLYTVFSEPDGCELYDPTSSLVTDHQIPFIASRKLDFTCCDNEPGVLGM